LTTFDRHTTPELLTSEQADFIADNFAALGDPSRARIIFALTQGEQSVNALAEIAGISPSAVSHHLARLRSLRLVKTRRAANQIFYKVDDGHVAGLFREMLSHLDHIKQNLPDHSTGSEPDILLQPQGTLNSL
jgi:DNA-binding transcriptional ArsR family regulator